MRTESASYKVKEFLMFAGVTTFVFCAVVILPFLYGLYLTFTSWDGVSRQNLVQEVVDETVFHDVIGKQYVPAQIRGAAFLRQSSAEGQQGFHDVFVDQGVADHAVGEDQGHGPFRQAADHLAELDGGILLKDGVKPVQIFRKRWAQLFFHG